MKKCGNCKELIHYIVKEFVTSEFKAFDLDGNELRDKVYDDDVHELERCPKCLSILD